MFRYNSFARHANLSGPTSFAKIIRKAVKIVRKCGGNHHVLIIITDGQLPEDDDTAKVN